MLGMSQVEGMGGRSVFCQTLDSHNDACAVYCLLECDVVPCDRYMLTSLYTYQITWLHIPKRVISRTDQMMVPEL